MTELSPTEIREAVRAALDEDIGTGDATTLACIPADSTSVARMVAREALTLCGVEFAREAFLQMDPNLEVELLAQDGAAVARGTPVLRVRGSTRAILTAERVALNFVQRLSGVATLTARHVAVVAGTGVRILDTRKTTPGWRRLEKYAVACGGGTNHRQGLHDQVLIKDNHLAALHDVPPNPVAAAVARARALYPDLKVEVEADHPDQAAQAADAGADIVLLDNMPPDVLREAVRRVAGRAMTEASGGITLETLPAVAATGVDAISVGALTHSARAVDLGLDFLPAP